MRRMTDGPTSTDFESWYAGLTGTVGVDRRAKIRPWFRSLYDEHGPVSEAVALEQWRREQFESSELAVALTVADIHRTTAWPVEVGLSMIESAVEITVEGHTRAPATTADPWDQHAIVSDIAAIIQEDVVEWHHEVWPLCTSHGVELSPQVKDERAVWWCRGGGHAASEIGLLGA